VCRINIDIIQREKKRNRDGDEKTKNKLIESKREIIIIIIIMESKFIVEEMEPDRHTECDSVEDSQCKHLSEC
jgi:hypothetical protein